MVGFITSFLVLRGSDLTRLMVTLGVALVLREIANRLDGITGGADGLQGIVMEPLLGHFAFDIFGKTAYIYCLAVLFVLFLIARRIVNSPGNQEQHEQHGEAVDVGGLAENIEREVAEQRLHHDALQAVGAAGDVETVRDLAQHQRDAERHHQAGQVGAAQHQEAGDEAEHGCGKA